MRLIYLIYPCALAFLLMSCQEKPVPLSHVTTNIYVSDKLSFNYEDIINSRSNALSVMFSENETSSSVTTALKRKLVVNILKSGVEYVSFPIDVHHEFFLLKNQKKNFYLEISIVSSNGHEMIITHFYEGETKTK